MIKKYFYAFMCIVLCIMLSMCSLNQTISPEESAALLDYAPEWVQKMRSVQLNETIRLDDVFPFEWDTVKIANCPMGLADNFNWKEIYDYDKKLASSLSSHVTISVMIFYLDGCIVEIESYNFSNKDSIVIRPYKHERVDDICTYDRENAIFYYSGLGSLEERIFIAVQQ